MIFRFRNILAIIRLRDTVGIFYRKRSFVKKVNRLGIKYFQIVLEERLNKKTVTHILAMFLNIGQIFED